MRIPLTRVGKDDEGDAMYPGRKDVADKKKKEKNTKANVCEKKKTRPTDDFKESASCQGFTASPDRVQSPARNKYNRNLRLTSRIDNDLLLIERDTADRSPSILLDRENSARSDEVADVRTRTRNPVRSTALIS